MCGPVRPTKPTPEPVVPKGWTFRSIPALEHGQFVVHIDGPRLKQCMADGTKLPIVRVVFPSGDEEYCDSVDFHGPCWLKADWDNPLPGYKSAVCVVRTRGPITIGWAK